MTKIVTALNEGRVQFSYKKADGSMRQATGTTNPSMIPQGVTNTNSNTDTSETINYFDLDRSAWRAFRRAELVESSIVVTEAVA